MGITSVSAYVNVNYFFTFRAFLNVKMNSGFRFLQTQMSAVRHITSRSFKWKVFRPNKNFLLSSLSTNKTAAMRSFKNRLIISLSRLGQKCFVIWNVNQPAH